MMISRVLVFLIFFGLNSCGFTPIYKLNENLNFKISEIDLKGDRLINNYLNSKFEMYKSGEGQAFSIRLISDYSKIALSKDSTGKITDYKLSLNITINVEELNLNNIENFEGYKNTYQYNEEFILEDENFKFKETSYENNIKRNLSDTVFNKFILSLINR